jgi:hypothetical protein
MDVNCERDDNGDIGYHGFLSELFDLGDILSTTSYLDSTIA